MGEDTKITFNVVGLVTNSDFQKCKYYVERLFKKYPDLYETPNIRPMLNVDWTEFLNKVRRKISGRLWELSKPVAVFINGSYLGDDVDLEKYISRMFKFSVIKDFKVMGDQNLVEIIQKSLDKGRKFVYFWIAIDRKMIGALLFLLYCDLVPKTCEHFLKKCKSRRKGYLGSSVHRIAKPSWIQVGGHNLEEKKMPCENYTVPHDRRGVLSMANAGRHKDNSTQFHISLNRTSWMDYHYVAFGQLVQGEEVLQEIEKVPTHYESPTKSIDIIKCGEYTLDAEMRSYKKPLLMHLGTDEEDILQPMDVLDDRDVDSLINEDRFHQGQYAFDSDLRSYYPFLNLPEYLLMSMLEGQGEGGDENYSYAKDLLDKQFQSMAEEVFNPLGVRGIKIANFSALPNDNKTLDPDEKCPKIDSFDDEQSPVEKLLKALISKAVQDSCVQDDLKNAAHNE